MFYAIFWSDPDPDPTKKILIRPDPQVRNTANFNLCTALISYNVESVPTNNTGTGHCLRFDAKAGRVAFTVGVRSPLVDIMHTTASILVAASPPMRAERVGTGTA